jgi:hypothetical protein
LLKQDFIESITENLDQSKFKIIKINNKYFNKLYKTKKELDGEYIKNLNDKIK